ncbi:MAG: InlB B-repeat-containing protein [Oscillospiraceae bacterium]
MAWAIFNIDAVSTHETNNKKRRKSEVMKKRLVAFLLVLIMVLGMLPVSAMAAGSVVTARGSAENPIRIYENSGNKAETSNGSVQVPVGETVTDSGVLTFSTYSAIEGVQVSTGGFTYCDITSSNENVVKATGSWSGGVLTINFLGVGNGTAKITVDYTCTCSKNAVANGLLIYNVTVGDGGSTDPSGKPNAPTASDIGAFPDAGKAVLLHCVDAGARGHDATASSLNKVQNGYSVGEVVENPGTYYNVDGGKITKEQFPWMCVVTVHAAPFIELYNSNFSERYGVHKLAGTSNATATLHWFWHNTYGWQYLENPPIQFNITRDTSEKTYTLNYYKNTTDTVTNMPVPNPQTEKSNTGMVTFTVSNARPSRDGYTFLGWAGNPDATTATVQPGNTITTPRETTNLYAVWESKTPPPEIPGDQKPNIEEANAKIRVQCIEYPSKHNPYTKNYRILPGSYDDLGWDRTEYGYIYSIRLNRAKYIAQFDQEIGRPHTDTEQNKETRINWRWENGAWHLIDGPDGVTADIKVKCAETPVKPEKPTALDGSFAIVCKNNEATHAYKADYIATPSQYTISDVQKDEQGYYVTATVTVAPNLVAYNKATRVEHRLVNEQDATLTITFRYDTEATVDGNRKWKQRGDLPVVEVICKPKAPTADELKKLEMAVQVKCVVDASQQHTAAYGLLGECDVDYFVFEPRQEGDDWLCDISYYPERYVAEFNTTFQNLKHVQNDEKIVPVTLIWAGGSWQIKTQGRVHVTEEYTVTYTDGVDGEEVFADQVYSDLRKDSTTPAFNGTPTRTGYTFAGWEPEVAATVTQTVTYVAKWEAKKANVHLMIFKSGDLSKPIVDVPYAADKLAGDTIDLTKIDPSSYLDFDFEIDGGWYDDGMFNSYKRYLDGLQDKPAGLEKLLITGNWQNLKLIVTELVPVVYFDSLESLTAYQNDHSKTEGILRTTKARVGSALPTADAPTATRDGYTFTFWSREGQTTDVTGQTVNGWTNLVANWKVTPHNIYAYARLNSYFAPLTTSEFDTPVTLNEATLSRLGLGSYNSLGYISIGSFTFDAMPLTSDLYFGDDAELSAVAEKLATDIALETGVSDKIAEKIAWTALYKTVNEEDMEPGYPAEAGYQLSGNLNLASVTFRAGAENVENMPAVNYTYDDGAIDFYDFYFAGDTITLPTTEPTREGYSFKGWSVEVIPAENDADHLDADGADDAADETLLKAGDTYTITAGGVIFTAQWEKKTFTVKYYLPDETGAWVEKKMDTVDSVDYATYSLWTPNAEDGYEFSGWYQKPADIGVKAKVEKLYMAKEWKLYGKFTPIEYTIQYVYNDGKATSTNPTTYTVESDTITLADATGADWGKTFLEWHDENGQKITEIPTGSTGDRVITAYWNWPVHLHYLDKDNNEIDSATLYVSELEPGACVLPTGEKTGYDFDGWYEAQKDIGTASHKLNALSIAKKWELYGRYTAKTDVSYTVKYLREGDNKVLAPEKVVTDQTFDTEVTEQAADVVGYTPDAPSKTMILDEYNKVLTFSYSANTYDYTVRHIKQLPDGSYDEANAEVETLSGKFEALAAVTAKDYGEHYPTNDADTKQNIKIEEGLTIDVKYDLDEHTLTFETNGGSAINPVTVRHGNAVARPADPTKDKYTFIGWYADPEFTEEYDFATVLEADKTIYAKFELTSTPIGDIYVRYDVLHIKQLPDGTYDLANAEVEHLSAKKDTTVTAVIKDYRATHHVNVNRTLSKLTGTAIQPYKGVDGKPVYTILSVYYDLDFHTLTFDTMGGSKIAPETVRHGLTVAKPKDPVNGGYIFDGWYTDKTFRHRYDFSTPLTEDITIYAKWFLIVLPGVTVKKNTPKLNTADHFAYVQGYPDGTVKPAGNITRAETAAILFRLMDDASRKTYYSTKSGFRDVASGSWYNTYVATLNNAGVITDSSNGCFRPNEAITRAELAAMLAKFSETTGAANYFNDVSAKYWAANAIAICAKLGWINGYPDGTFRPDKNVTRAELMAMINRATGRAPKSADAFLPGMKTWIDNTADKWYYLDVQEATNSHSYTVKGSETWTALTSDPNWSLYE